MSEAIHQRKPCTPQPIAVCMQKLYRRKDQLEDLMIHHNDMGVRIAAQIREIEDDIVDLTARMCRQ